MMYKCKRIVILSLTLVLMIPHMACKSTPKKETVVSKGDGQLMETIQQGEQTSGVFQAPGQWNENFIAKGEVQVEINASVIIPNVSKFPVIQIEPARFGVDKLIAIKDQLFGQAQLYRIPFERKLTKSQIMEKIVEAKKQLSDPNSDLNNMSSYANKEAYDQAHKRVQDTIKILEAQYKSAPEKIEYKKVTISEEELKKGFATFLYKEDGKSTINFSITDVDAQKGRYNSITCYFYNSGHPGMNANIKTITLDEAEKKANELITKIDANNMFLNRAIQIKPFITSDYNYYKIIYTTKYNTVSETYSDQEQDTADNDQIFTYPWWYEKLVLTVDCAGVVSFEWDSPSKIVKTLADNVKILPFDQVQSTFKQQIGFKAAYAYLSPYIKSRKIVVEEVRLGMMRVSMKDSTDQYMVIPVWDFFGYTIDHYSQQEPGGVLLDQNNDHVDRVSGHSLLTINAIDGSVIDRNLGY
jgi:hypothetical protein